MVFSWYLVGLGLVLLAMPNVLLGVFGMPTTTEVWVRVVGMLVLFLAYYYHIAARNELTALMRGTVHVRSSVIVFFTAFVLLGYANAMLIGFGVVDLFGAIWTAMALRETAAA